MQAWLKLFHSPNSVIRRRAAQGLLQHGDSIPLPVLLEILDELHSEGLGAMTERVLKERRDPDLSDEMLRRLRSLAPFVREVACRVLGGLGDLRATPELLKMLDDPAVMVRRAAGFALATLKDPEAGPALRHHYERRREEINVRMALESAMDALGLRYERIV